MEEINLVTRYKAKSPFAEAYRAVRTNLQFSGAGSAIQCIIFTSAAPREGKSTTAANMAIMMAQDGKKLLLIDADMRKAVQHIIFNLPNKGLSNCISMNTPFEEVVQKGIAAPNLDILPGGPMPPNPAELLNSANMAALLRQVRNVYDYIFIDMPPIMVVTDAAVLASKADRVVLVVRSGVVPPARLQSAKERLEQGGARLLGVILNCVPQYRCDNYGYGAYYDEKAEKQHHESAPL